MERHREFGHIGRALEETADFFGERLERTVYHGINRVMFFSAFEQYFNAPTSTTIAKSVGMFIFEESLCIITSSFMF